MPCFQSRSKSDVWVDLSQNNHHVFVRNSNNLCLHIFSHFTFFFLSCTGGVMLRPPTVDILYLSLSPLPEIHRCSGELPTPGLCQPYSLCICIYVSGIFATWMWGDSLGVSVFPLNPLSVVCSWSMIISYKNTSIHIGFLFHHNYSMVWTNMSRLLSRAGVRINIITQILFF